MSHSQLSFAVENSYQHLNTSASDRAYTTKESSIDLLKGYIFQVKLKHYPVANSIPSAVYAKCSEYLLN